MSEEFDPFSTLDYFNEWYERSVPFFSLEKRFSEGVDLEGFLGWKESFRRELAVLLGMPRREPCPLDARILTREEMDGFSLEKVVFRSEYTSSVPAYLLRPEASNGRAVIAVHGHGYGKDDVMGFYRSAEQKEWIERHNYSYALELVKRGYTVLAPDQRCFGEREFGGCRKAVLNGLLFGETLIGLRVFDIMRCIDYLESREDIHYDGVGCVGFSGGGTTVLFTAALEDRVSAVVVSGYVNTFKKSIMDLEHCECNYIPGILRLGEMCDVASLIAPKPFFIESGEKDDIYPLEGAESAVKIIRKAYALFGAENRLYHHIFPGPHSFGGGEVFRFLEKWAAGGFGTEHEGGR